MTHQVSFWESNTFLAPADIIIVGAGFAGLWCAFEIKKKNTAASVLVLERNMIPTGASTRNAGFACFGSPTEMLNDAAVMHEDKMWSVVEMRYKGIEKIRQIFDESEINFDACGGYECLEKETAQQVADKLEWLNKGMKAITGDSNCYKWSTGKMKEFGLTGFDSMIENQWEGGLHSGKLLMALQQRVQQTGIRIMYGAEVTATAQTGNGVQATINNNFELNCGQLIYCTNAFTNALLDDHLITPARGQVLVTAPIKNLALKGTFHYDEGYYYFRNVGDRVLIGGARNAAFAQEETTQMQTSETIQHQLKLFLQKHVLSQTPFTVEHRWSGIMAFTKNKLPVIKQVDNNTLSVIGCNGMGVALLPMVAEQVAALY